MEKRTAIKDRGVRAKSRALEGRLIALGVCGGIAAVETVKVARELRRHGARVKAFFTPSVKDFIGELPVEWATGEKVVRHMGAEAEHLEAFDLVLVAPATLNTISKAALGLADNAVTLLIAGQLGRRSRLAFVPTMNAELESHPLFDEYVARLEGWGAKFLRLEEEDRLKMPPPERVAEFVVSCLK